jgi:hypothetical protein
MADYIKREDALKIADEYYNHPIGKAIAKSIFCLPAANVRPVVRGRWNRTDAYPHRLYCSVCYKTYLKNDELLERWEFPLNFCPNCGADNREELQRWLNTSNAKRQ